MIDEVINLVEQKKEYSKLGFKMVGDTNELVADSLKAKNYYAGNIPEEEENKEETERLLEMIGNSRINNEVLLKKCQ